MRIAALVENTSNNKELRAKHGLCIYIETARHKLLFDLGPDETYLRNAKSLGVDIAAIDTVIISHGHKDHGGALENFLRNNNKATVYVHQDAFQPHYVKVAFAKIPVGLNPDLQQNNRIISIGPTHRIDEELFLFSDVNGQFKTRSNQTLLKKDKSGFHQDAFSHEQNLLLNTEGKIVLFSGCSHKGIANIMNAAKQYVSKVDVVVGGFHLYNPATKVKEPDGVVAALAEELKAHGAQYYTCHCTGPAAFREMRKVLGPKLNYLSAGDEIIL